MSFGFGFGLPSWQTLSGGFSPASLFTNNEQGVWYEPAPNNGTLFQDSAGTTPVTAVEQFVGLMLDKSKGLVLGSELVTNGDFSNGTTGWTGTLTLAVVNGELQMTRTASGQDVSQIITTVAGQSYKISVSYRNGTTSSAIYIGSTAGGSNLLAVTTLSSAATQTFTAYFTATNATSYIQFGLNALGGTAFIDNVTVKSIAGNHATSTGTKRPKLAARYNLLTRTEEFNSSPWTPATQVTVTANSSTAPNGTATADTLTETADNIYHSIYQTFQITANATFVFSCYLKAGTWNFAQLNVGGATSGRWIQCVADLTLGTITQSSAGAGGTLVSATISNEGSGWYRIFLTGSISTETTLYAYVGTVTSGTPSLGTLGTEFRVGNTGRNIIVWGADLRPASQATGLIGPTYQRVVDAATYDTAGFLPYLQFDGIDDSMSTGSIDFTATDKMTVWAGVRKTGVPDGTGFIYELSVAADTNNGAFRYGVESGGIEYFPGSRGTAFQQITINNALYAPPVTNVLQVSSDISAPSIIARINGSQVGSNTSSQGTGNYGNYPLFIGSRNNASVYFQGWLTSLIVRGAQSTQSQIEATESWVNQRTGAF